MARHMHCLPLLYQTGSDSSYPDFHVISTFQKMPTAPTVFGRKVGITFCPAERNPWFCKSRYNQVDFSIRTFLVQLWMQGNLNLNDKDVKVMERRILLDDLTDQTSACMRDKLKLSLRTVYGQSYGYMKMIQDYCLSHGEKYYI